MMTILFVLTLVIPPAAQVVYDVRSTGTDSRLSAAELLSTLPSVAEAYRYAGGSVWDRLLAANRRLLKNIEEYEKQLQERSLLTQCLLGPTQLCLTREAGLGNERAYVGREGWLFYRPDVDYLTGAGFLEPAVLKRRATGGAQHAQPPQPDPRP